MSNNSSISNNSVYDKYTVSMSKIVPFQIIQFSISTLFRSIWLINRIQSGVTTPSPSEPGRDDNEGMLCILQSSSITRASPSDCLELYSGHSLGESYSSVEMQSVFSATRKRPGKMKGKDLRPHPKITVQKFSKTSHEIIKIQCFKTEKYSTTYMQIFFRNSIIFFLKYCENSYI